MYEKIFVKRIVFIAVIILFIVLCTITRVKNDTDTEGTISDIRKQQQSVNYEIGNVESSIGNARQTIAGANKRVGELQRNVDNTRERLVESKREIANLSKLARECKSLAEANGKIIDDVRKKNQ